MRIKKGFGLFLIMILVMTGISGSSVSAQDIDISNMDNAQLLQLLQVILNKLDTEEAEETAEPLPAGTDVPVISVARFSDGKLFQIYGNKKLIIESIPGYMFYQPPEETPEPEKNDKKDDDSHGWVTDEHGCEPGQQWVCDIYHNCYCTWAKG